LIGYHIYLSSSIFFQLSDIDECMTDDKNKECHSKNAFCSNTPGSYVCLCQEGYQFGADGKCHGM